MSKKVTVNVYKGPHFEHVEKLAYGYLNKILSEMAMADDSVRNVGMETSLQTEESGNQLNN